MAFSSGVVGASAFPDGVHLVYSTSVSTSDPYTFSGVSYGPEHPSRELFICVVMSGGTNTATTVVVDGVAADEKYHVNSSALCTVARKVLATGTSGTIVCTPSGGSATSGASLFVYRGIRRSSGTSGYGNSSSASSATSYTVSDVTIPIGGVEFTAGRISGDSLASISGTAGVSGGAFTINNGDGHYSWYVDGTNYTTATTPSTTATFNSASFFVSLSRSW